MKGTNEKHWKCLTFYFSFLTIQYCSEIAMYLDCRDLILSDFHLRVQGCQKKPAAGENRHLLS